MDQLPPSCPLGPDDVNWREVADPHTAKLLWRCRAFQFEFRWTYFSDWYPRDYARWDRSAGSCLYPTRARKKLWRDLWLHP